MFHISFCVRVPLNNTKNHVHKKRTRKLDFYIFVIKWYFNIWGKFTIVDV